MEAFFFLPKCFLFGFFYLGDLLFLPLGSPRMFGSRIEILCPFSGAVSLEFSYASLCLSGVISGFAKKLQTSNTTQVWGVTASQIHSQEPKYLEGIYYFYIKKQNLFIFIILYLVYVTDCEMIKLN